MAAQEFSGKVHEVGETQEPTSTFKKRDLIILDDSNPTYPEYIRFEAIQDKVTLFDELRPGDSVNIKYNLRGKPWTDKSGKTSYFNSLVVWQLNITQTVPNNGAPAATQQQAKPTATPPPSLEDEFGGDDFDADLGF